MRAWIVEKPGPIETRPLKLVELPVPQPGSGEALLRVEACGVCHTDLHIAEGDLRLPRLPIVPGHQVVGVVEEVASASSPLLRRGERVGVMWLHSACGSCAYCRQGLENLCDDAHFTGLHANGGYAEYMVVPAAFALPIPPQITSFAAAPLLCAGVIGYRALRLSEIRPGERLGLFGFGASAHLVIQVARSWGCQVYVFTRSRAHQELARELGAAWAGTADETPPALLDSGIIFAPAGALVPAALRHLRKGGTLAINAIHLDRVPEFPYELLWGERTIRSVANVTRQDGREFLALAAEIPIQPNYQVFPFEAANEALLALKRSEIDGAAVLAIGK